jgi:anti-sigma B factor antagonist
MNVKKANDQLEIIFDEKIIAAVVEELTGKIKLTLEENNDYSGVIANFSNVEFIDSTGITLVIGMYRSVAAREKQFSIIGAKDEIKNLFSIIQLDKIFKIA